MSLILDALKKSETERAGTDTPSPQLSSFDQESQPENSSRIIVYVATVGIAIFGGIAGYGFLNYQNEPVPVAVIAEKEKPAEEIVPEPVPEVETTEVETVEAEPEPLPEVETTKVESEPIAEEVEIEEAAVEDPVAEEAEIEEPAAEPELPAIAEQPAPDPIPINPVLVASPPPVKPVAPPALESVTAPPVSQPTSEAKSKINRGWAHLSDQDYGAAIAAFKQARALSPDAPDAFFGLGWAYEKSGQIGLAIDSYTQAAEIDPDHVNAIISRGFLQYYEGKFESASEDFRHIIETDKGEMHDYALLWAYLSMARAHGNTAYAHSQLVREVSHTRWPGILFAHYMGTKSRDQVETTIQSVDGTGRKKRECVGYFFVGQLRLLVGDIPGAREAFQKTLATGMTTFRQFAAARVELDRLVGQ